MSTYKIIKSISTRCSVRKFDPRLVSREKILACIEAARMAPSAENAQPWRFVVLDDPEIKCRFGETAFSGIYRHTRWAIAAPVLVVLFAEINVVTHRIGRWLQGTPFFLIDIGIAGEHFVLQAQRMGLGTCWIGWFDVKKTEKFFRVPKRVKACGVLAVGYPHSHIRQRHLKRKPLTDIASYNEWIKPITKRGETPT